MTRDPQRRKDQHPWAHALREAFDVPEWVIDNAECAEVNAHPGETRSIRAAIEAGEEILESQLSARADRIAAVESHPDDCSCDDCCTHEIAEYGRCVACSALVGAALPTPVVGCGGRGWYHDGSEEQHARLAGRNPKPCPHCARGRHDG